MQTGVQTGEKRGSIEFMTDLIILEKDEITVNLPHSPCCFAALKGQEEHNRNRLREFRSLLEHFLSPKLISLDTFLGYRKRREKDFSAGRQRFVAADKFIH